MEVFQYKNYDEYVRSQKNAYHKKFKNVWSIEENIRAIAEYLKQYNPQTGICHGVRQGFEVLWFKKYLPGCEVIGTDIGDPVLSLKNIKIIQHDFNLENENFIERFDFIYSNSFDHAYDPAKTFSVWFEQLKKGGRLVLEYDRRQEHTGEISKKCNKTDPVSIRFEELKSKILKWDRKASIEIVLDMPAMTFEWRRALVARKCA